jgi:predicted Zn-ribbon and HTH transcriptional regulator
MTQGTIDRDIPCRDCGYNLRSLSAIDARCPECGLDTAQSLNNWLADIDLYKSHLLSRGAKWTLLVVILRIPLMLLWTLIFQPYLLWNIFIRFRFGFSPNIFRDSAMNPVLPIAFLAVDCIAFVYLSSLRHPHIRKYLPTLAAAAVVVDLCFFGPTVMEDLVATLIVIDLVFFAAIAYFWSRDGVRIAQKAGERKLANGFAVCSAVLPFSIFPFLAALQIFILDEFTSYSAPATFGMQLATDIILIPAIVYFCYLLLVLNGRLGKTLRLARALRGSALPQRTIEPAAAIDRNILCRDCGYNLRTLLAAARCPECGRPVADSLQNWLQEIDPHKSRLLQSGATLVVFVALCHIFLALAWVATLLVPELFVPFRGVAIISEPLIPLIVLALDCFAFIAISPLRQWHVRLAVPLLALASAAWLGYSTSVSMDPLFTAVSFYILEAIFFCGIAFFWCTDALRIARLADERRLYLIFLCCAALIPLITLFFVFVSQSPLGLSHYLNRRFWLFPRPHWLNADIQVATTQILIIPVLILMSVSLLSLRSRIHATLYLAQQLEPQSLSPA